MTVMSGRWVPPANGSFRTHEHARRVVLVEDRRHRGGHRAEVHGDVLGLHHHLAVRSNRAVEASWRSLMLDECAERISTAPISSHAARSAPVMTCSSIGSSRSSAPVGSQSCRRVDARPPAAGQDRVRHRPQSTVPHSSTARPTTRAGRTASPRAGDRTVGPSTSARRRRRRRRRRLNARRCAPDRRADRHQLDLAVVVAVAVALLVRAGERLAQDRRVACGRPTRLAARRTGRGSAARSALRIARRPSSDGRACASSSARTRARRRA